MGRPKAQNATRRAIWRLREPDEFLDTTASSSPSPSVTDATPARSPRPDGYSIWSIICSRKRRTIRRPSRAPPVAPSVGHSPAVCLAEGRPSLDLRGPPETDDSVRAVSADRDMSQ